MSALSYFVLRQTGTSQHSSHSNFNFNFYLREYSYKKIISFVLLFALGLGISIAHAQDYNSAPRNLIHTLCNQ